MRFHRLDDWLQWQETLHPKQIELGLERVALVWSRLWPEQGLPFRVITVAGTNGKGSTVAFLESILKAAGYRVGCFTSPHLVRYNERIRIDGRDASDDQICTAFERIDQVRTSTSITYFEFSALAALSIFCDLKPDVAVLEVGLGGRLDAVNIIDPNLAIITTIGLDHIEWLGDTLDKIALEKAGIMRPGKPVVCASPSVPASLIAHAAELQAELHLAGVDFMYRDNGTSWDWWGAGLALEKLQLPSLQGRYQLQNAAGVLMALMLLRTNFDLTRNAIDQGLKQASVRGRFQIIPGKPYVVLDVAHNPEAVGVLAENLRHTPCSGQTRVVFGIMKDKDVASVVSIISDLVDKWYLADLGVSRGLPVDRLHEILLGNGVDNLNIADYASAGAAYAGAIKDAAEEDRVIVFGSFWLVGDILNLISNQCLVP